MNDQLDNLAGFVNGFIENGSKIQVVDIKDLFSVSWQAQAKITYSNYAQKKDLI